MKTYRLKKSLHIFHHILKLYRRKRKSLPETEQVEIVQTLNRLQKYILEKDRTQASETARRAERFTTLSLKKSPLLRIRDFIVKLGLALLVAILIRTMWFELYEIPTGSMRPTFAEKDRLVVSKTAFGVNVPLKRGHFLFDPALVVRNGIIIFTGAGMDIHDVDTLYFYLFPGKKQFVKRLIGKPGDTLYFYGGKIYGIDKDGGDISNDLNPQFLSKIDHVPYIYLNGKVTLPEKTIGGVYAPVILKQMNEAIAKLSLESSIKVVGEILPPFKDKVEDYYDLWGFNDYGLSRLLSAKEVENYTHTPLSQLGKAPLYMEIVHHPTVKHPKIRRDPMGRLTPSVGTTSSVIPLSQNHLDVLKNNLYTARFTVKNGRAYRYGSKFGQASPTLTDVPDGTYEFYYGQGYRVHFGGITTKLPKNHPLYEHTPERLQLLYNLGIEWMTFYSPYAKDQYLFPSRYVYYRDGDLFAMGAPMMKKDDPTLLKFIEQEHLRQKTTLSSQPYIPFIDPGPPLTSEKKIDKVLIEQKGIKIPPGHYMALGDNYAMSADSRDFGFVPEENIRGAPDYIFWPPGSRLGAVLQAYPSFFNLPRLIVWVLAFVCFGTYHIVRRKQTTLPQKIE